MNRKKIVRRLLKGFLILIIAWVILAQFILKERLNDKKAKQVFSNKGITLITGEILVDGLKMHYVKTGNDSLPTLFFVHGSPSSWIIYMKYLQDKDLLSKYRMIAIDRPGFGYSNFGNAKNLDEQSRLISPVVKSLQNGKPIYAVGHSLGGPLIAKLQIDYQNIFSGLVFIAAAVDPNLEGPEKWRYIMKMPVLTYLLPGAFRPSNDELIYLKTDLKYLDREWERITCPAWIIHGNKDDLVPVENVDYAKKKLVNARSVKTKTLPGADHMIPLNRYNEVKDVLMRLPI
jgi:pimeloyl-ACP methyl ester carboxylesterase